MSGPQDLTDPPRSMARIVLLATGGTISMQSDAGGAAVRGLQASRQLEHVPSVEGLEVVAEDFSADYTIGFNVTADIMRRLAQAVDDIAARPDVDGVVVTHGTDVMEEVASFVDCTLQTDKPIVFTGAMRHASMVSADGPRNIHNALLLAAHPAAAGRGVLVCVNDEIHAARRVTKTHSTRASTFASPNGGAVGAVDHGAVEFYAAAARGRTFRLGSEVPEVSLVWVAAGAASFLVEAALERSAGVVLAATGIGHVPQWWMPSIRAAVARGVSVVLASRCGAGSTGLGYAGPGGDYDLAQAGVIFAGYRRPLQARTELMCALAAGLSQQQIRAHFASDTGLGGAVATMSQ